MLRLLEEERRQTAALQTMKLEAIQTAKRPAAVSTAMLHSVHAIGRACVMTYTKLFAKFLEHTVGSRPSTLHRERDQHLRANEGEACAVGITTRWRAVPSLCVPLAGWDLPQ